MISLEDFFQKKLNESQFEYTKRIIMAKSDKIIDTDYVELSVLLFGQELSSSECRKRIYGCKRIIELLEDEEISSISDDKILKEIELKKQELIKEKMKFYDQRVAYKKELRLDSRWDDLKEILFKSIEEIKPYTSLTHLRPSEVLNNDLLVGLSDLHFGVEIDNFWNKYNPDIAKIRLNQYLEEIISIQKTHKSENCYVCINGDLISGNIHYTIALANKENIVKQIMNVSELISWFLSELSKHFNSVYMSNVAGNHSRLSIKDNSPKDERLDDLIPFYVKARLQNLKNINILNNNIDNTVYLVNIRGLNYLGVHGDMDRMNSILKLVEMIPEKIYSIIFGHLHHNSSDFIQGYKTLICGSLMGIDDYCIEKRIFGKPQQLVCVCTEKGVMAMYDVFLD